MPNEQKKTPFSGEAVAMGNENVKAEKSLKFYRAVWRWHFYAGLYVIPFMLVLAVTGLMMMYFNGIDNRYGMQDQVSITGEITTPAQQVAVVQAAYPDGVVTRYLPPEALDKAAFVEITIDGLSKAVSVDPYQGKIMDMVVKDDSAYYWANDVHGSLLIGDLGDRLLEIAAGLTVVLLVSGLYMWWPRDGKNWSALVPNLALKGRNLWRELHLSIGFYISVYLLFFLLSGLSWTGVWGGKIVQPWSSFPAEKWDNVPLSDEIHASMNHGALEEVAWGLEQTKMPLSGSEAGITGIPDGYKVDISSVTQLGYLLGFGNKFRVNLPQNESGVYTITDDAWDGDSTEPTKDRTVHVDQYTGKILGDVGYDDYSLMAKTMAVSTSLHQGDMGLWNLILNTIFCLAVVFLCVSGIVMWWKRRPAKAFGLQAPPLPANMPLWKGAVVITLFLSLAMPLVGVSLLVVLVLDWLVLQHITFLKRLVQ